jgi:tRNA(fMet)-specific endonuclease VapC
MVIVDTNVLISSIRGNMMAMQLIKKYMPEIRLSVITEVELYIGATNKSKKNTVAKILSSHEVIPINKSISEIAIRLVKTYNTGSRSLYLPDAFIAATCLHENCRLLTFNTKDFKFIKGLHLAL